MGWQRFPFHYTLLALIGIDNKGAQDEMQYAAPRLENMLKRSSRDGEHAIRKQAVAELVLARI